MRLRSTFVTLFALCVAAASSPAQSSRDSVHAKMARDTLASIRKRTSSPTIRRQVDWLVRSESALVKPVAPPPDTSKPPAAIVSSVEIHGTGASLAVGASMQLTTDTKNSAGVSIPAAVSWSVDSTRIASISGAGLLTGKAKGTVTVRAKADTATGIRSFAVTDTAVTPIPPDTTKPPPVDTTTPPAPDSIAGAAVAIRPLVTPNTPYPSGGTVIPVAAGADLQAALSRARAGDVISLEACATWTGVYTLPNRADSGWVIIRTAASDAQIGAPGVRMTPTRAASACLAKIVTPGLNAPALGTAAGAHGWRITGVEVTAAPGVTSLNMLVKLDAPNGNRTIMDEPRDIVLDRVYIHGNATLALRRCVVMNSGATELVDSWLGECHDPNGDSQGTLTYNGTGPHRIENNHIEFGHQCFMSGGADPAIQGLIPSDITFRRNHCYRPPSWVGVWQAKTIFETKNIRRVLIIGNVFENTYADAQAGFCLLLKSTNQDGTAPWSQTLDVTVVLNIFRNCGSGANFAAAPQGGIPATRFYLSDNLWQNLNVSPWKGDGIPLQLLSNLSNIIVEHQTWMTGSFLNTMQFDGAPMSNFVYRYNVAPHGAYGVKGSGTGDGTSTLNTYAPGAVFTGNAIVGGGACTQYPTGNVCPSSIPATLPLAPDGRPIGADLTKVNAATAGVVVAP